MTQPSINQRCELKAAVGNHEHIMIEVIFMTVDVMMMSLLHPRHDSRVSVSLQVATLDWLEKKAAAALYQSPPTSTLHDALENFLKVPECCR